MRTIQRISPLTFFEKNTRPRYQNIRHHDADYFTYDSNPGVMETPKSVSGSRKFTKKQVASSRDIKYKASLVCSGLPYSGVLCNLLSGGIGFQEQSDDPQEISPV